MADKYRMEFIFRGRKDSWGESYIVDQDQATVDSLADEWVTIICPLRAAMLGRGYTMEALRVSKIAFANGTPVTNVVALREFTLSPDQADANAGAQQDLAIQMRVVNSATNRRTFVSLGGFPDAVEVNAGIFTADPVGWGTKFNSFAVQLQIRQVGWIRNEKAVDRIITGYVQNPAGEVTFTVTGAPFVAPFPGAKTSVRVSGLNGTSELNAQLVVRPSGLQTVATAKPYFVAPFATQGKMQFYTHPFIRGNVYSPLKIVRRKRGSSLFSSRGRSKARAHG